MNISESTIIVGYSGKRGTLAHALTDKTQHRNIHYDYFGKRVTRGTVEVFVSGRWQTASFRSENSWITEIRFKEE